MEAIAACISVRVPVASFRWGKTFRSTRNRNADLIAEMVKAQATTEQYRLFRDYIDSRHSDGGMADMTVLDFSAMVDESFVETRLMEYRTAPAIRLAGPAERKGELIGAALIDVLEDGLSMIYSFYKPDDGGRSLGTFMILDMIARAKAMGLTYVYLGYWIEGSDKMAYKSRFLPQERLTREGWVHFDG